MLCTWSTLRTKPTRWVLIPTKHDTPHCAALGTAHCTVNNEQIGAPAGVFPIDFRVEGMVADIAARII